MQSIDVLLVEDNPADALLTREMLEASKVHIDLRVASDGAKGLEEVDRQVPDLVLLDLNMPGTDGREFLAQLRAQEHTRRVPVVVLTSSTAERDIIQSYDLGANAYVVKPVGFEQFEQIVAAVEGFWFTVVRLPPKP